MVAVLFSIFGMVAAFLGAVGLYGVASFAVSQRTRDLGIRMALGAGRRRIAGQIFLQAGIQFAVGTAGGIALALALVQIGSNRFEDFLYEVSPHDPVVYSAVAALLAAASGMAYIRPARRAARVDPMMVLRNG